MPTVEVGGSAGWDGLAQVADALRKLGDVAPALSDAMAKSGGVIIDAASGHAPSLSGRMVGTLRAITDDKTLRVVVGGPAAPYALNFHARKLGKSGGYFTFKVPGHTRGGRPVSNYKRVSAIPDNPFLIDAAEEKTGEVFEIYEGALRKLWEGVTGG